MNAVRQLRAITERIYADFFMPSRLFSYRQLLEGLLDAGYVFITVRDFASLVSSQANLDHRRLVVLRQDVDTDPATSRAMWQIEKQLRVQSTRYFRLGTLDFDFMKEIAATGSEASYHYEELSSFAKRRRLKSAAAVRAALPEIRDVFAKNLEQLRQRTGLPMDTVASHGDFVNRRLGVINKEILDNADFRAKVRIRHECYDTAVCSAVRSRHSDRPFPELWDTYSPLIAAEQQISMIYVLLHPRHWRSNAAYNFRDNLQRMWEGVRFTL